MTSIVMYDSAYNSQFPPGGSAYAAYVDGHVGDQPNYQWIVRTFPLARHLSITIDPHVNADCLDIEAGAASPESAAGWYARQRARGITRPCLYASASMMQADVVPAIEATGIVRPNVRLWSAHYGAGQHICGPRSCGLMSIEADGTQWTDKALGRDLDESVLLSGFFGAAPPPSPLDWQEAMMQQLPVLREGATGADVRTVQGLLVARGRTVMVDGVFGPATAAAVAATQRGYKIAADSTVGPVTWAVLVTGSVP